MTPVRYLKMLLNLCILPGICTRRMRKNCCVCVFVCVAETSKTGQIPCCLQYDQLCRSSEAIAAPILFYCMHQPKGIPAICCRWSCSCKISALGASDRSKQRGPSIDCGHPNHSYRRGLLTVVIQRIVVSLDPSSFANEIPYKRRLTLPILRIVSFVKLFDQICGNKEGQTYCSLRLCVCDTRKDSEGRFSLLLVGQATRRVGRYRLVSERIWWVFNSMNSEGKFQGVLVVSRICFG